VSNRVKKALSVAALMLFFGPAKSIQAAGLVEMPELRIESDMHINAISSISTDASGALVLTTSNDRTARLWDLSTGRLIRVLRPSLGNFEGVLSGGKISPDGKTAAIAGFTTVSKTSIEGRKISASLYLFDTASGRLIQRIGSFPVSISQVSFSKSGKKIAVGLEAGGISIWDAILGRELGRDTSYSSSCKGLAWFGDSKIVSTCWDGKVRMYSNLSWDNKRTQLRPTHFVKQTLGQPTSRLDAPFPLGPARDSPWPLLEGASFSPDGKLVAVGISGQVGVVLLSGKDLQIVSNPDVGDRPTGPLSEVSWNADGRLLAAGGMFTTISTTGKEQPSLRVWQHEGTGYLADIPLEGLVSDLTPLPLMVGGGWLYSTSTPTWGVVRNDFRETRLGKSPIADYFGSATTFAITADAKSIRFAFGGYDSKRACFDLSSRLLVPIADSLDEERLATLLHDRPLHVPRIEGIAITDWEMSPVPKWEGVPVPLIEGEISQSLAVSPDGSCFLLGTNARLICGLANRDNPWIQRAQSNVLAANFSASGRVAVVAYGDGTIHWKRISDGKDILTFFPHSDQRRWILWTPEGYYDCSPGGEDLIGWQVSRGKDMSEDFFSASRFRKVFHRPDVIDQVLNEEVLDSVEALHKADRILREKDESFEPTDPEELPKLIKNISPPVVELETGGLLGKVALGGEDTRLKVRYKVRQTGDKLPARVIVRFNGRLIDQRKVSLENQSAELELSLPKAMSGELSVFATVEDEKGKALTISEPAILRIERKAGKVSARQPRLFVVSVGVSHLATDNGFSDFQNLPQAANDAARINDVLSQQRGRLFAKDSDATKFPLLTDSGATFAAIQRQLQEVAREASFEDVFIFFFSGHGTVDSKTGYYAVTYDTRKDNPLLSGEKLSELIDAIKARTIVVLETCQSGAAFGGPNPNDTINSPKDLSRLVNQLSSAEQGVVVITSAGKQASLQDPKKGGPLTRALLEVLKRKESLSSSGPNKDDLVTCATLHDWIPKRVPEIVEEMWKTSGAKLTAGKVDSVVENNQHPTFVIPKGVPDFPIAKP
jgi:WD40 repeat protein